MKLCIICGNGFIPNKYTPKQFCCFNKTCRTKRNNQINNEYKQTWAKQNQDKVNTYRNTESYKTSRKKATQKYRLANKEYYANYDSLYTRRLKQACPLWADKDAIQDVYLEAQYLQLEVDHIIPLKHPLVCGLHVWDNLQLLSRSENAKKSNKFSQDVLVVIE